MIKKSKHGYEFSWENWNSIQKALLDESEAVGDKDAPDDIDISLFNNLSNSFLGSNQLLAAEFITDEEQIKQDLLCYLIRKDNSPIDVAYGVEITKIEKEYYPHAIFHINCEADWNATSIWEHQETYQVAKQVTVYVDYRGREHSHYGKDREITSNGSVYRERKPFSKTVYEDKTRVVTDSVQQTSGHIGPREYFETIGTVTSEIADTVMKWADNYASDRIITVNDEYFSNYNRIAENLTFDEAEDQAVKKAFAELKSDARYHIPGDRYESLVLSGHDIHGVKRLSLFLSVYHIFYKYNGKEFDCYMSSDGCKDDVIVSNYPTEESIDEKHIRFKEKIEKKKKGHSIWLTLGIVLLGGGILLAAIALFGGGLSWGIAAIIAFLIGLICFCLSHRDKKEIKKIEESIRSFDDNNNKIKEKIYSIIQDDSINEEERKKTVKEYIDNAFLDNEAGKINKSENTLGQPTKGVFIKNGKITTLGLTCVIGPLLAIAIILSIIAGIKSINKKSHDVAVDETKSAMEVATENESKKADVSSQNEKEQKSDTNESLRDFSDETKEGGLPEGVYEQIKGTYYSGVNFLAYKVISPTEIIHDNGTDVEAIKIEKYEYIDDALIMYVDTGSIVKSWKNDKGEYFLSLWEGGGWEYEKAHCYSTLERISEYTSISFEEIMDTYYSTKYYVPDACLIKKTDGFVYLVPATDSSYFYPIEGGDAIPFTHEMKITKNAQIGLAESSYFDSNGALRFNYEYYDFYDKYDQLYSIGHWEEVNNMTCFVVGDSSYPLCPIVTMDPNIQIDTFMDGFLSYWDLTELIPATNGEMGVDGDISFIEGEIPDDILEQIGGRYIDDLGDIVDFTSPTSIVRYIPGGHQDHTYNEKICGYSVISSYEYYIYVECDKSRYTYWYTFEGGGDQLYINLEDEWNPTFDNYYFDLESGVCFIKEWIE